MVKGMKAIMATAGFALLAATAGCSAHASGPSPQELAMQRAEQAAVRAEAAATRAAASADSCDAAQAKCEAMFRKGTFK